MRLSLQRALLLLALYGLVVGALAWWANEALDAAATTVMDDTAHLVASEVAAALDQSLVNDLMRGTAADRLRLLTQIFNLTQRSATVRSAQVVDSQGEIFASNEFVAVGRRLPP